MFDIEDKDIICDTSVAKISIVGAGMESHPGTASKMFEALYERDINIDMIATRVFSPLSIPETPIQTVQRPMPVITAPVYFSLIPFLRTSPIVLPKITVSTLTKTPSIMFKPLYFL